MAKAYAHLEERERILCFIDNREAEIEELISESSDQNSLFAIMIEQFPHVAKNLNPLIEKNKTAISEAQTELEMWKAMRKELNPCKTCKGYGELRVFDAPDSSYLEPCKKCSGSGLDKRLS